MRIIKAVLALLLTLVLSGAFTGSAWAKRKKAAAPAAAKRAEVKPAAKTAVQSGAKTAQSGKKSGAKAGTKVALTETKAEKRKGKRGKRRNVSRSRRRGQRPHVASVPRQAQPAKERYSEIQQALFKQGYYMGEPNGEWSADSVAALKQFQEDQSIRATGRINALSLIALGLGPKRGPLGPLPVARGAQGSVQGPPVAPSEAADVDDEAADALEEELEVPLTPDVVK
jgi:hypothetical protein